MYKKAYPQLSFGFRGGMGVFFVGGLACWLIKLELFTPVMFWERGYTVRFAALDIAILRFLGVC